MITRCRRCNGRYDDDDHDTACPHEYFEMHTLVYGDGRPWGRCVRSIAEMNAYSRGDLPPSLCLFHALIGGDFLSTACDIAFGQPRSLKAHLEEIAGPLSEYFDRGPELPGPEETELPEEG